MYRLNDKIKDLKPYDPVQERYRIHLDANESFLTLPEEILDEAKQALEEMSFNRYPDPAAAELCRAFAAYYNVDAANVVAGNGSDELISVIFSGFLEKGDSFATIEPDFSMYAFNGTLHEGRHVTIKKRPDFTLDIDNIIKTCNNEGVKLLIFSNPCNPTSVVCPKSEIRRLLNGVNALVILDEAYMDFSDESLLDEVEEYDNLIILRTCSKAIGMAAMRLGFSVSQPALANAMRAIKSPYNVNSISQSLGTIVLSHPEVLEEAKRILLNSAAELLGGIRDILLEYPGRFKLLQGEANFAALDMSDGRELYSCLEKQGIAVRYTGGLIRITCGQPEENMVFLQALRNYLRG